jgi:hypothetical protein
MDIRAFKTFTVELNYFSINVLPTVSVEWYCENQTILFIGWLIWGIQLKWYTTK